MNIHDIEQERQKFEAFMREKNPSHDLDYEFGIYRFSPVQRHWDTWQAAIEADRKRMATVVESAWREGWKACRDSEYVGSEAEDSAYGDSEANRIALGLDQGESCGLEADRNRRGEPVACNACDGSERMVRDPDIGTDQECFVCDGSGIEKLDAPQPAEPVKVPSKDAIRDVFLANGFTIKPGEDDLKPYVYEAAYALLAQFGQKE